MPPGLGTATRSGIGSVQVSDKARNAASPDGRYEPHEIPPLRRALGTATQLALMLIPLMILLLGAPRRGQIVAVWRSEATTTLPV